MATSIAENSINTFLSLRARLRTPDSSSQHFSGRVAKAARPDGPKFHEHLFGEFRKILSTHFKPDQQADTSSAGQNYALLEQLANCFAATGSNIHHQCVNEIDASQKAIQSKISELSRDSNRALITTAKLYGTIAHQLEALACAGPDGQVDTIGDQMALLQEEFANANEKIHSLYEKWQSYIRAEQDAWQRLTDEEDNPRQEADVQDLLDQIEEAKTSAEAEIQSIEAEYAQHIQIESLKVMQTLMEG